ncbi:type II secretion system F family protein [Enterobacter cloacae complex sp. P3B]|uniref:type II secretion system F family protein n=1 Tax=unclassified Enterobacter cloacae complex TaxID=2757714 RepID=UPI001865FB44|nr:MULTISPECIES: type II secretion system F family protein [unclassified Enterobacter cloacae complex]MBE3178678.1 type II secretion system F family protein [Enterobacter cloacae complex sp. P26RS]MBE3433530.1 type II secretion system F family protein [Enterobacter cloacae complex sp. P21RS]MBE3462384.1 type II secretion system F family protein [Enterobacter cloacae complex sp. P21C]MBE3498478.1 type II secretion system F family protein [Enterobacter cloacae complex sp. P2B]MBE3501667.1 type I
MKPYTVTILQGGKRVNQTVLAASPDDASARIIAGGGIVLQVQERPARKEKRFPLNLFLQELIALLEAGLVVVEAVEALRESSRDGGTSLVLDTLVKKLYEGAQLSQAMMALPALFPPLLINTVASSEQTGHLPKALKRFQFYESRMEILRKRIKSTLLYPTIVIAAGGIILFFLLGFIIPRFSVVFDGMKNPSASAQLILWWGRLTQTHGSLLLAGCAAAVAGIVMAVRSPRLRQRALGLLLRIPALRQQHQLSVLVRFYRTLGLLLQGGLPAPDALMLSREILPATHRQQVEQVIRDVAAGESLSRMLEAQQMTTPVASRLLQVGERSGELPAMCERIAAFYDESLERSIETFSKIFEPILMMVVGGIVGLVVFLLYMPIFELAGGLQ